MLFQLFKIIIIGFTSRDANFHAVSVRDLWSQRFAMPLLELTCGLKIDGGGGL
jgi:hypothetical protein